MMDAAQFERRSDALGLRLWDSWRLIESVEESVEVDGVRLLRAGFAARRDDGVVVSGAAASADRSATTRASFELAERASLMDAMRPGRSAFTVRTRSDRVRKILGSDAVFPQSSDPERWQPAKSNGVALGVDWVSACESAELELAERDRITRSWLRQGPVPVPVDLPQCPLGLARSYEVCAYALPAGATWSADLEVAYVVGFPRAPHVPLVRGSAAARGLDVALARAAGECLQGLAFLSREDVPAVAPVPSPTPMFHLEHYLWPGSHAALREWLDGGQARLERRRRRGAAAVRFIELTPPAADGRFRVAKAQCDDALELVFGERSSCDRGRDIAHPHPIA